MGIYQRRPTSVEAFQVSFPIDVKTKHNSDGFHDYIRATTGDWVVLDERGNIQVMSNENFTINFEIAPSRMHLHTKSPGVNSRTITPEDVDMMREIP
jgi:hypothetical protein